VYAGTTATQVTVHFVTFEALYRARALAQAGRVNDNEIVVVGDRTGQCEAQCAAVQEGHARRGSMMLFEMADDVYSGPLIGEQIVTDTEDERGLHTGRPDHFRNYTERISYQIMCLGIPMQIKQIDGFNARCEAKGVEREVSLFMLQHEPLDEGDFVVVHVGYAIQKVSAEEAATAWDIYDEMLAKETGGHA